MHGVIAACAGLALLVGVSPRALGAGEFVIDQDQPVAAVFLTVLGQPDLWQSFQQSSDVISGAGVFLYPGVGDRGTVRIELWNGPPKADGGGTKGERLAFADAAGVAGSWVDVFWTSVSANPATTYFLVFEGMGQANDLGLAGAQFAYPRGEGYVRGMPFLGYDYTFRTYGPPVPEPTSASLLLAGLLGLLAAAALRKRTAIAG